MTTLVKTVDSAYEVLAIRYGTFLTDRSHVYLGFSLYHEPNAELILDYYFWVIRNAQRVFLVDCGFNPAVAARRGRITVCPPVEALTGIGLAPEDLDAMVITHAHYDHIGNLNRFNATELVASEREVEFWCGPLGRRAQFAAPTERSEIDALRAAAGSDRLTLFAGQHTLAPGIELVEVGGHTPGQVIVLVSTISGLVVLTSDSLHLYEELERDWPFAVVADLEDMYRGYDTLRELSSGDNAVLVPGHDPEVMKRFPNADVSLEGLVVRIA